MSFFIRADREKLSGGGGPDQNSDRSGPPKTKAGCHELITTSATQEDSKKMYKSKTSLLTGTEETGRDLERQENRDDLD